jgi:hypothetical protein
MGFTEADDMGGDDSATKFHLIDSQDYHEFSFQYFER